VLGILESAGLEFDALWVSGLTEEAWPLAARPNPFLPVGAQKEAGIPQASAEASLALDRELTARWREAAAEVVFSSAAMDGDRELLASPLVADVPAEAVAEVASAGTRHHALFAASRLPGAVTVRADAQAPLPHGFEVPGGTEVLRSQAACPFRAFAHHRLDARALETPDSGLENTDRGQLLHAVMAHVWGALRDHATLVATTPGQLEALTREAADAAVRELRGARPGRLDGRFAELERERLARIAFDWLEIERGRAPFEVHMREERIGLAAGGLAFEGRVDRIDQRDDGALAVIDYKSGQARSAADSLGGRDIQLAVYILAVEQVLAEGQRVERATFFQIGSGRPGGELAGDDLRRAITVARERIAETVAAVHRADFRVRPRDACPDYCEFEPICRRNLAKRRATTDPMPR